jgi:2-polyprenyl-3-methyl-5-hydroxy-6-metoxy-1,4-benzoquinol methylase
MNEATASPGAARYDEVADFYAEGFPDRYDDSATEALLALTGTIDGLDVLDLACGHGRISRELARRGGRVFGVDIARRLVEMAEESEQADPLGVSYAVADASERGTTVPDAAYDLVVCCFGLSDIDDLEGAVATVQRCLRPSGRFVFSILHPCFPGAGEISGSWQSEGDYFHEGRWTAVGSRSTLRGQVGANHRKLSTYVTTLAGHGLLIDVMREPAPPADWKLSAPDAARHPVFLAASCTLVPVPPAAER